MEVPVVANATPPGVGQTFFPDLPQLTVSLPNELIPGLKASELDRIAPGC